MKFFIVMLLGLGLGLSSGCYQAPYGQGYYGSYAYYGHHTGDGYYGHRTWDRYRHRTWERHPDRAWNRYPHRANNNTRPNTRPPRQDANSEPKKILKPTPEVLRPNASRLPKTIVRPEALKDAIQTQNPRLKAPGLNEATGQSRPKPTLTGPIHSAPQAAQPRLNRAPSRLSKPHSGGLPRR